MAKKNKLSGNEGHPAPKQAVQPVAKTAAPDNQPFLTRFKFQVLILVVLGFIFYGNTFSNGYALDDRPIIVENEYVQQGIAGIPKIFTGDAFESYLEKNNSGRSLAGGRYRPLSIVSFAIEQQILGLPSAGADQSNNVKGAAVSQEAYSKASSDMHLRHVVNVLLYILSVVVLLYFLRTIVFPGNYIIPFVAALLFLIHPIHTEVVANVKSRDEILSFLFIGLTFIYAFKYYDHKKKTSLYAALLCFLLALLSKEYALTMIILLPLSFYLFRKETIGRSFSLLLPYIIPLCLYGLLRFSTEHNIPKMADDITSDPYLLATSAQRIASIIAVLVRYLQLLLLPHPLSSDYSYAQLPYSSFGDAIVWVSLLVYTAIIVAFVLLLKNRHVLAFALAIYLANLALVSNIFVGLGATMGERLIYHSSLGFTMAVAYLLYLLVRKASAPRAVNGILTGVLVLFTTISAYAVIQRNEDWNSDRTLFLTDVQTAPNSLLVLTNAGSACIDMGNEATARQEKKEWYQKGVAYCSKAIAIYRPYPRAYSNRGVCYFYLGEPEKAFADWDTLKAYNPSDPSLPYFTTVKADYYSKEGLKQGAANNHDAAIAAFSKALTVTPLDPDVWFNLGVAYFSSGRYTDAINALDRSLQIRPGSKRVLAFYQVVTDKMKNQ